MLSHIKSCKVIYSHVKSYTVIYSHVKSYTDLKAFTLPPPRTDTSGTGRAPCVTAAVADPERERKLVAVTRNVAEEPEGRGLRPRERRGEEEFCGSPRTKAATCGRENKTLKGVRVGACNLERSEQAEGLEVTALRSACLTLYWL
jgi:hypothetical protein